jgi:hypothetical protein
MAVYSLGFILEPRPILGEIVWRRARCTDAGGYAPEIAVDPSQRDPIPTEKKPVSRGGPHGSGLRRGAGQVGEAGMWAPHGSVPGLARMGKTGRTDASGGPKQRGFGPIGGSSFFLLFLLFSILNSKSKHNPSLKCMFSQNFTTNT